MKEKQIRENWKTEKKEMNNVEGDGGNVDYNINCND